jgi:hypothetical protein
VVSEKGLPQVSTPRQTTVPIVVSESFVDLYAYTVWGLQRTVPRRVVWSVGSVVAAGRGPYGAIQTEAPLFGGRFTSAGDRCGN